MFEMSTKGTRVREMFKGIAVRYDFLNRLLSFGFDTHWRRFAVGLIDYEIGGRILDSATGTGDMALHIAATTPSSVGVVGMDFCKEMIEIASLKAENSRHAERIAFTVAPCEGIPFRDCSFDSVTIAFGVRNLDNINEGLKEMYRVLKPGGKIVILEFSVPGNSLLRSVYSWYFKKVLPLIGGLVSNSSAYNYLPKSVYEFPSREDFKGIISSSGFIDITHHDMTGGIVTIFIGKKQPHTKNRGL